MKINETANVTAGKPEEISKDLTDSQIWAITLNDYTHKVFYAFMIQPLSHEQILELCEGKTETTDTVLDIFMKNEIIFKTNSGLYDAAIARKYHNRIRSEHSELLEYKQAKQRINLTFRNIDNKKFWEKNTYFASYSYLKKEDKEEIYKDLMAIRHKIKTKMKEAENCDLSTLTFVKYSHSLFTFLMAFIFLTFANPSTVLAFDLGNNYGSAFDTISKYGVNPSKLNSLGKALGGDGIDTQGKVLGGGYDPGAKTIQQPKTNNPYWQLKSKPNSYWGTLGELSSQNTGKMHTEYQWVNVPGVGTTRVEVYKKCSVIIDGKVHIGTGEKYCNLENLQSPVVADYCSSYNNRPDLCLNRPQKMEKLELDILRNE